jgi:hypothetical protein
MSLSTIAATRQKEMNASMALDATRTRAAGLEPIIPEFLDCISLARPNLQSVLLSTSARLAVGLGLKGVLPRAAWAGLTDSPRRNSVPERQHRSRDPIFRCGSPAPAELRDSTSLHCSHWIMRVQGRGCAPINFTSLQMSVCAVHAEVYRGPHPAWDRAVHAPVPRAPLR